MRIGDLSEVAGVSPQTIRFYERRGLLPEPARAPNGYRDYDDSVLARLAFIRSGQAAGLTLLELRGILDQRSEGAAPCAHVQSLLLAKLDDIRDRQRELAAVADELENLISRSQRLDPVNCSDAAICHIISDVV